MADGGVGTVDETSRLLPKIILKEDGDVGEAEVVREGGQEEEQEEPGFWRCLGVIIGFLVIACLDGAMYSFAAVFQSRIKEDLHLSTPTVNGAGSLQVGFSAFVAPLATMLTAWLDSKLGPKWTSWAPRLVGGLGSMGAAFGWWVASCSKDHGWELLFLGQFISGVGFGFMYVPPVVALTKAFKKRRNFAIGFTLSGAGFGQVVMGVVLKEVGLDWEETFRWLLPVICLGFGLLGLFLPEAMKDQGLPKGSGARAALGELRAGLPAGHGGAAAHPAGASQRLPSVPGQSADGAGPLGAEGHLEGTQPCSEKEACSRVSCVPSCAIKFLEGVCKVGGLPKHKNNVIFLFYSAADYMAVFGLYIPYASMPQLVDVEGEAGPVPMWLVALGSSSMLGRWASGFICDQASLYVSSKLASICLGLASICPCLLPFTYTIFIFDYRVLFYILLVLLGSTTGAWIAATPSLIIKLLGEKRLPPAFGGLTLVRGIAAIAGPALSGKMADLLNLPKLPFYWSSISFAAACIVFSLTGNFVSRFKRDTLAETSDTTSESDV